MQFSACDGRYENESNSGNAENQRNSCVWVKRRPVWSRRRIVRTATGRRAFAALSAIHASALLYSEAQRRSGRRMNIHDSPLASNGVAAPSDDLVDDKTPRQPAGRSYI